MLFALSDFTRLRVVRLLAAEDGAMYAKELSAAMNVPSSHLSRHLQVLFASGLVRLERQGARVQIRLITESVEVAALATAVLARAADGDVFRQDLGRRIRED